MLKQNLPFTPYEANVRRVIIQPWWTFLLAIVLMDGYEITHIASGSIEEVPYFF